MEENTLTLHPTQVFAVSKREEIVIKEKNKGLFLINPRTRFESNSEPFIESKGQLDPSFWIMC